MPKIVQFLHTALEATPLNENEKIIQWNNNETHRRKFLKSNGKYIDQSGYETEAELTFWGEWEPQSEIYKLKNTKRHFPKYLNIPFLDTSESHRTHNTDPYVFGERFKYIICKQHFFHNALVDLEQGSLILFGSSINRKFCLDTLFVVSSRKTNYTASSIKTLFPKNKRGQYYFASVEPIFGETNCNITVDKEDSCRIIDDGIYTYYESINYSERDDYQGMFSFVPSKIFNEEKEFDYIFKQPIIDLDFLTPQQTQAINTKDCSLEEIVGYWKKIKLQIENKELMIGNLV